MAARHADGQEILLADQDDPGEEQVSAFGFWHLCSWRVRLRTTVELSRFVIPRDLMFWCSALCQIIRGQMNRTTGVSDVSKMLCNKRKGDSHVRRPRFSIVVLVLVGLDHLEAPVIVTLFPIYVACSAQSQHWWVLINDSSFPTSVKLSENVNLDFYDSVQEKPQDLDWNLD